MEYSNIYMGIFIKRPNRFIAIVQIEGREEVCHVKNTGRCRELLIEGVKVLLEKSNNQNRKTQFDLVAVYKGELLINMDSQAPNKVAREWLEMGGLFAHPKAVQPEKKYGASRIDFYIETQEQEKILLEVKGVTLEQEGICMFPDAPTERGIKHIKELEKSIKEGYQAYILFVIQMKGMIEFRPNDMTHKAFGEALRHAVKKGVHVLAYECMVTENHMEIDAPVKVVL